MLFTVPVLRSAEVEVLVEPDVLMRDDGCEERFAKAHIHDEIPWMGLRHKVRDLMILTVPDIALFQDDLSFEDAEIPADGMEAYWTVADDMSARPIKELVGFTVAEPVAAIAEKSRAAAYSVLEMSVALFSSKAMQTLCAPVAVGMLPMPGFVASIEAVTVEDVSAVEKFFDNPLFGIGIIEDVPVASEAVEEAVQIPVVNIPADYCTAYEEAGFDIPYDIIVAGIVGELVSSMLG